MSREHAYAYEAGYRDGSINYELEHCPACKNVADLQEALEENTKLREQGARLFDKTLELGTENAKLREERDMYCDLVGCMVHPDISDQLQAEVAALRELVRDFDKCLTEAVRLAYIQGHATIYDSTLLDSLHPRMRELGIEEPK